MSAENAAQTAGGAVTVSAIVPVCDEAESLGELHKRLREALGPQAEILYVDDGSRDRSLERLLEIARGDGGVRVIGFRRRFGKSAALLAGFRKAEGRVLVTLDADLQDDPQEIPKLLAALEEEGLDLAGGYRKERNDPVLKVAASRLFNRVVSLLGGVRFRDINCGLKALRREVVEDLPLAPGFHRFLPLLAHWRGYRVGEREVVHHPRRYGRSRYGGERLFEGLLDLLVVLFLLRFEGRPGRLFAGLGCALGAAGGAISAYIAYLRLAYGSIQSRYPLLALGLALLIVGLQFFSLGLFGELLAFHLRSRAGGFAPAVIEYTGRHAEVGHR